MPIVTARARVHDRSHRGDRWIYRHVVIELSLRRFVPRDRFGFPKALNRTLQRLRVKTWTEFGNSKDYETLETLEWECIYVDLFTFITHIEL